jgi:hypothetical protein
MGSLSRLLRIVFLFLFLFASAETVFSQENTKASDTLDIGAVKIYLDCSSCDDEYFRTELTMANFVRVRKQADIHILVTRQHTGGGGREYTIEFIGQNNFGGMRDTLLYHSRETDTEDKIRSGLLRTFNMGLVRYVARTPQAEHVSVKYSAPRKRAEVKDKWNYWVFEIGTHLWTDGQKSETEFDISGDLIARRVTEDLRLEFSSFIHYDEERFEHDEGESVDISKSKGVDALAFISLGDHWSVGASTELKSSTYRNERSKFSLFPGVEYNFFPYSESTRHQFRFTYYHELKYVDYEKETLYDKHNEWLYKEYLEITLEMIEPWGEAEIGITASHHFHDISKYRLVLEGDLSLRIYEGFSFNI